MDPGDRRGLRRALDPPLPLAEPLIGTGTSHRRVAIVAAAAGLIAATVFGACSTARDPAAFAVAYETGSIPPPYNYAYRLAGRFDGAALDVTYALTYRYRQSMSSAALASQGYSKDDDIQWSGRLEGDDAEAWRMLLRRAELREPPAPMPGSDSFVATIGFDGSPETSGLPADRERWQALIDAIDARARAETGNPRSSR